MIEEKVKKIFNSIDIKYKYTFVSALVCGLCAHLYHFTNKIPNYDEYGQTPGGIGATLGLGRWGLELLARIYGFFFGWFSFPMVNGPVALFFIIMSACLIVAAFDIRDRFLCMLTGGICVVFPTVVSTYFFMFTAHYYAMSLFGACLAALLLIRNAPARNRKSCILYILSTLLACLSTGIYQAYASVFICILFIDILIRCYEDKEPVKSLIVRGIIYLSNIALSLLLYFGIMKTVNAICNVEMGDYHNLNNMSMTFGKLFYCVLSCYRSFFGLLSGNDIFSLNYSTTVKLIYGVMICIMIMVPVLSFLDKKKTKAFRLLMVIGTLILPVVFFSILILSSFGDGAVYTIMVYPAVFILIYPLALCDRIERNTEGLAAGLNKVIVWTCAASVLICVIIYSWFANANYQGLQYTHYHDLAYFQTLMTQIKSLDGYSEDMPVAILGEFEDDTNAAGSLMEYHFHVGGKWESNINYKNRVMIWFCYLGFTPDVIEDKERLMEISQKSEVINMPTYPSAGSVAISDGIVVVKANESIESYALY